ncbi:FAD-binding protein [Streptomyces sp. NPDC059740]|uniref:FAD-binding protein n=1 Tax=Streptomyces sp. NPDC059740 TaxID=3346926 RepID=UPI0036588445
MGSHMRTEGVDLLVMGAGMAGLTAGAGAVECGLSGALVEIAADVGGSARFAGCAWTTPSREAMDRHNLRGDVALKHALVDRSSSRACSRSRRSGADRSGPPGGRPRRCDRRPADRSGRSTCGERRGTRSAVRRHPDAASREAVPPQRRARTPPDRSPLR